MDQARSTTRIALISTESMLTVAEDWRNRLVREMPGITAVHLSSEVLRTPAGTAMHLDVEAIVVFAGEERAAAEAALKVTLEAVEPPESESAYLGRLKRYPSGAPAQFALEVAPGTLEKLGVRRGSRVEFDAAALKPRIR